MFLSTYICYKYRKYVYFMGLLAGSDRKNLSAMHDICVQSLGQEDSMEKGVLPSPVFLPGKFHGQSMGSQRISHNWVAKHTYTYNIYIYIYIQKRKIMASGPIISWEIDGETVETASDFIFLGSKITADGDCSHEIKRCLLLGRKVMTNLDSIF